MNKIIIMGILALTLLFGGIAYAHTVAGERQTAQVTIKEAISVTANAPLPTGVTQIGTNPLKFSIPAVNSNRNIDISFTIQNSGSSPINVSIVPTETNSHFTLRVTPDSTIHAASGETSFNIRLHSTAKINSVSTLIVNVSR
jgi:hypothetical protein